MLLFLVTALGGGLLYPDYRVEVRPALEDLQLRAANGIFEIKEHLVAVGLGVLPGIGSSGERRWRPNKPPRAAT